MQPSAPSRPVMDVAKPAPPGQAPAQTPAPLATPPASEEAPKPPADNQQEAPQKKKEDKPEAPETERNKSTAAKPSAPAGLIVATVFIMVVLSGLAVLAYATSQS